MPSPTVTSAGLGGDWRRSMRKVAVPAHRLIAGRDADARRAQRGWIGREGGHDGLGDRIPQGLANEPPGRIVEVSYASPCPVCPYIHSSAARGAATFSAGVQGRSVPCADGPQNSSSPAQRQTTAVMWHSSQLHELRPHRWILNPTGPGVWTSPSYT